MKIGLLVRFLATLVGLFSTILTVDLLIDSSGNTIYAVFVVITSIPNLIPFADFGIGSNVFNFYVDKSGSNKPILHEQNYITRIFSYILSGQLILLLISILIIFVVRPSFLDLDYWNGNSSLYIFINLLFTFIAVPFSIGARKLQAERKISTIIAIQGFIPLFICLCLYLGYFLEQEFQSWMLAIPSLGYLITTLIIFFKSGLHRIVNFRSVSLIYSIDKLVFNLGFWSLTVTTLYSFIWQTPKYFFSITGNPDAVSRYALLLMLLLPQLAIINVITGWYSPLARKVRFQHGLRQVTYDAISKTMLLALILAMLTYPTIRILRFFGLTTPDFQSSLLAVGLLLSSPFWIVSLGVLSEIEDFKWLSKRICSFFLALVIILGIFRPSGYINVLVFYFTPIIFANSVTLLLKIYNNSRFSNSGAS